MKRLLLCLLLVGCAPVPYPVAPVPIPQPQPQPQPEPTPQPGADLAVFLAVKSGDDEAATLEALPKPTPAGIQAGDVTIRSWTTNVPRPSGGFVAYEIHFRGGKVVAGFPW